MFKKLTTLLPGDASQNAPDSSTSKPQKTSSGNLSILQLCDQKLDKWSRFFALEDEVPQRSVTEVPPEMPAGKAVPEQSATIPETPPPVGTAIVEPEPLPETATPADVAPAYSVPPPVVEQQMQLNPSEPPAAPEPAPEMPKATAAEAPIQNDQRIESLLERLSRYIEQASQAENALAAFQEEIRQTLATELHNSQRHMQENKDNLEIALKSAFKKLTDRQNAWETSNNQNIDLLQQIVEAHREIIADTAGKLNDIAAQVGQLKENIRRVSDAFEDYKTQAGIETLKAQLTALERKPQRKSWFGKK